MAARLRILLLASGPGVIATIWLTAANPCNSANAGDADKHSTWEKLVYFTDIAKVVAIEVDKINAANWLKTKGLFSGKRKQLEMIGNTFALMGNLGIIVGEGEERNRAAALREAGLKLVKACRDGDFDAASAAFKTIATFPAGTIEPATNAEPAKWVDLVPRAMIMKQIDAIDKDLAEANKKPAKEFNKLREKTARSAMMLRWLAVIYKEHNEAADWQGWCDKMQEGTRELAKAYLKGSAADAQRVRNDLEHDSCVACHNAYRSK